MIRNRETLVQGPDHGAALDCLEAAIRGADPETATREAITRKDEQFSLAGDTYDLSRYEQVLVVGAGKAAGGAARALETVFGDRIDDGIIITKQSADLNHVRTRVGDHPIPAERSVEATGELVELVTDATEEALIVTVVTGGASALLSAPADGLDITDLRTTTERLLKGGVPIDEVNTVRKHLSAVKGGQLAQKAAPATVIGLLLSDVVGDDPSAIGSGPTVPDETTRDDALTVFDTYGIEPPGPVRRHLEAGGDNHQENLSKIDRSNGGGVTNHIVASNATALAAARTAAREAGYKPLVLTSCLRGEAREVARPLVAIGEEAATAGDPIEPPAILLAGGETTVTVSETGGTGGPNQELVLSATLECNRDLVMAAIDTDGEDGSSGVAGAIANGRTVKGHAEAREHLDANDAGGYFAEVGATIETGPTGTNVNDVVALVVPNENE